MEPPLGAVEALAREVRECDRCGATRCEEHEAKYRALMREREPMP